MQKIGTFPVISVTEKTVQCDVENLGGEYYRIPSSLRFHLRDRDVGLSVLWALSFAPYSYTGMQFLSLIGGREITRIEEIQSYSEATAMSTPELLEDFGLDISRKNNQNLENLLCEYDKYSRFAFLKHNINPHVLSILVMTYQRQLYVKVLDTRFGELSFKILSKEHFEKVISYISGYAADTNECILAKTNFKSQEYVQKTLLQYHKAYEQMKANSFCLTRLCCCLCRKRSIYSIVDGIDYSTTKLQANKDEKEEGCLSEPLLANQALFHCAPSKEESEKEGELNNIDNNCECNGISG
jgi:hypothetical protein